MFFCCLRGWRRIVCVLDNLNHSYAGSRFRRLCDIHDDYLTRQMEADIATDEVSTGGSGSSGG